MKRLFLAALPLLLAACTTPKPDAQPAALRLPEPLAVGPNETLVATLAARGVQVYECRAGSGGVGASAAWAFVAPDAALFDADGRRAGHHGAGPYWQALDGSRIEAKPTARADAPVAGAIPWLLLQATRAGGAGRFAHIASVRRVHTSGGLAPAGSCLIGTQVRVPYTADYLFYAAS
jgi:hypothetical protein